MSWSISNEDVRKMKSQLLESLKRKNNTDDKKVDQSLFKIDWKPDEVWNKKLTHDDLTGDISFDLFEDFMRWFVRDYCTHFD